MVANSSFIRHIPNRLQLSCSSPQAYGNHEEEPFVLEGTYTQRVSSEASAQRLIDELTAEHAKREAP